MTFFYLIFGIAVLMVPGLNQQFGWEIGSHIPVHLQIVTGILLIMGGTLHAKLDAVLKKMNEKS